MRSTQGADNVVRLSTGKPAVVAIDMGYGHLRPATPLAESFGVPLQHMDRPPLGDARDARFWERVRDLYEPLTRASQLPLVGRPARALLDRITAIPPLHPYRDLSAGNSGTSTLVRMAKRGLGETLAAHLETTGAPLLTTFYAPAVLSELHGRDKLFCVVTDSDVNRVWAPADPGKSGIVYFAPTERTARRLESYGVRRERIRVTGFPLPHELLGGRELSALKRNLASRLCRLDPGGSFRRAHGATLERALGPLSSEDGGEWAALPLLTFAVGGAGAQVGIVEELLPSVARAVRAGRWNVALVAGRRPEVAEKLRGFLRAAGLDGHPGASLLEAPDVESYLTRFNALLARTDVLWTKPSEMTFFAALGLPLVLAPPVGVHELANERWAVERGAGLVQNEPEQAAEWLSLWLDDGVLAAAAWAGFCNLPHRGLYRIVDEVAQACDGSSGRRTAGAQ
ncbi:MAG: hypothetical protein NVS2B9_15050 [Myxococcales bacterium]